MRTLILAAGLLALVSSARAGNEQDALELAGCATIVQEAETWPNDRSRTEDDRLLNRIDFCEPYLRPWDQKRLQVARDSAIARRAAERANLNLSGL